jgi:hypothetical protein
LAAVARGTKRRSNIPSLVLLLFIQHINPRSHKLAVQLVGAGWETLHNVEVDRTSAKQYTLRPRINDIVHRLACDITLEGNVKVVTLRSTLQIKNNTMMAIEVATIDATGTMTSPAQRVGMLACNSKQNFQTMKLNIFVSSPRESMRSAYRGSIQWSGDNSTGWYVSTNYSCYGLLHVCVR